MKIIAIICEYNPLHLGHRKQLAGLRASDPDCAIVCLMSGNFVQRGKPAIVDKSLRAKAALCCGADLVLELPVTAALSSAEGFASEGVRLLSGFCHQLSFGVETGTADSLCATAQALLTPEFSRALGEALKTGLSFPAARQAALEAMGADAAGLTLPNDILGVEYCKAILRQSSPLRPAPIRRAGNYHDPVADRENPSATAVRTLMLQSGAWLDYVPQEARHCFSQAPLHTLEAGERAVLARLRSLSEEEFSALPYGSEGLWHKLMHACHTRDTLEEILCAVKSKRYTRTRLDRMVLCAFLGLTESDLAAPAPYARVLGLNDRGRTVLRQAREAGVFPNAGEKLEHPYQAIENRCGRLYGLFCQDAPGAVNAEADRRVIYLG